VLAATAAGAIGLLWQVPPAHAQAWPSKMIKLVVPFPAGGPTDTASRIVGQKLAERLSSPWWWRTAQAHRVPLRRPRS
jgi:tripartite-type tricarboxylate transporter receptor subunit TctC